MKGILNKFLSVYSRLKTRLDEFSDKCAEYAGYDETKRAWTRFGSQIFFSNLFKNIILLILILIFNVFFEFIVFASAYTLMRLFSFGLHIKNNTVCTIMGLIYNLGSIYLSDAVIFNFPLKAVLFVVLFILYLLYAPAESENNPVKKSRLKLYKMFSLICLCIAFGIALVLDGGRYSNLLILACVVQCLNILPLTYRMFNERRISS